MASDVLRLRGAGVRRPALLVLVAAACTTSSSPSNPPSSPASLAGGDAARSRGDGSNVPLVPLVGGGAGSTAPTTTTAGGDPGVVAGGDPAPTSGAAPSIIRIADADSTGRQSTTGVSAGPEALSRDGRIAVFDSLATDSAGGSASFDDVFARDLVVATTELVSQSSTRVAADGNSFAASISGDGRLVLFFSFAQNLAPIPGASGIFLHDRIAGSTLVVSTTNTGAAAASVGQGSAISADGRVVAFTSTDALVAEDTNGLADVFVKDLLTGVTTRVSVTSAGAQLTAASDNPSLSGDGRLVVFTSFAVELLPGTADQNGAEPDVFVHDRVTGATTLVSADLRGQQGLGTSGGLGLQSISADGRFVSFSSQARNLVTPAATGQQVFVKELATGVVTLASASTLGAAGDGTSTQNALSADGRFLVFVSTATNLVAGDRNAAADIFVKDRTTGVVVRVDVDTNGREAESGSDTRAPSISDDGRFVAFVSTATNLVAPFVDQNGTAPDLFVVSNPLAP